MHAFEHCICKGQENIPYTELNYNVHYHWGLIDVSIAHGLVTIEKKNGENFVGTLDGNSIPWNGRVFCVSDTLKAALTPNLERIDYVNGWYLKPKTNIYRSSQFDPNNPIFYKNIKGEGKLDASGETMEAIDITANMLSLFYYFRVLDFPKMKDGDVVAIPIQGAEGSQEVRVTYKGRSTFNVGDNHYQTYLVAFEFSYRGAMSGYTVETQISSESRIPLRFSSSLPIGHVEMTYQE